MDVDRYHIASLEMPDEPDICRRCIVGFPLGSKYYLLHDGLDLHRTFTLATESHPPTDYSVVTSGCIKLDTTLSAWISLWSSAQITIEPRNQSRLRIP